MQPCMHVALIFYNHLLSQSLQVSIRIHAAGILDLYMADELLYKIEEEDTCSDVL